jgi:L-alanine-DL-glutamate epimerase-like enolase superfamily enzyme
LIETKTPVTLRPDVIRIGGLTPLLKVAALAELYHRSVFPRLLPEVGVHLACGVPGVQAVEYTPALFPLFVQPPSLLDGNLHPPTGPGLGLELNPDIVAKYQIPVK